MLGEANLECFSLGRCAEFHSRALSRQGMPRSVLGIEELRALPQKDLSNSNIKEATCVGGSR